MLSLVSRTAARKVFSRTSVPGLQQISRRSYHENIVEHYENPRNVGSLDKNDASVGTVRHRTRLYYSRSRRKRKRRKVEKIDENEIETSFLLPMVKVGGTGSTVKISHVDRVATYIST
jgi:hypothetical protein